MKPNLLTHRYAKAFMELASQKGLVEKALEDLLLVQTTIEHNDELKSLMLRPFVSNDNKKNILNKLFGDRVDTITLNLLNLLVEKNREEIIADIYHEFYNLYLEHKKIAVVTVTSAIALDEKTTNRIVNIVRPKIIGRDTIQVENVIDRDIIGGFKVSYLDYEYDATVVKTLRRLRSTFGENLFVKAY